MLIFGEFNVFRPMEARHILEKAWRALLPDGYLLLEPHTFQAVVNLGQQPASWYSSEKGLFSEKPHLCLQEGIWDATAKVAIERYYVVDGATGKVTRYASSTQAYTDEKYRSLLANCGFGDAALYPSLGTTVDGPESDLLAILARRPGPRQAATPAKVARA
jgi:hypothetical protein